MNIYLLLIIFLAQTFFVNIFVLIKPTVTCLSLFLNFRLEELFILAGKQLRVVRPLAAVIGPIAAVIGPIAAVIGPIVAVIGPIAAVMGRLRQ